MGIELFNLPRGLSADVQLYVCPTGILGWESQWRKPRGVSMVFIMAIGAGGGGGGGFSAAATNPRGGGGGGGTGGCVTVLVPACLIPDRLYCVTANGGIGGAAGNAGGSSPSNSVIGITPGFGGTFAEALAWSDNSQAGGGGAGTAVGVGFGGTGATVGGYSISGLAGLGHLQAIAGQAGAAGGAQTGANGGGISIPGTGIPFQGGAGGAGTQSADFAGGSFFTVAGSYISQFLPAAIAAGSVNGPGGPQLWKPFFSIGGGGGSSSNAGVGGAGGQGAIGAGGGGGGGGTTGGKGGDGGPGAIMIMAW